MTPDQKRIEDILRRISQAAMAASILGHKPESGDFGPGHGAKLISDLDFLLRQLDAALERQKGDGGG